MTPEQSEAVEIVRPVPCGAYQSVLFDFDGTLSLLREGWPEVMIPMMVEILRQTGTTETDEALSRQVEDFVMRLNGRQTIYQMIQLADEVKLRGGMPPDPLEYKNEYHNRLMARISGRHAAIVAGKARREDWCVAGSHELLEALAAQGLTLYLASGTDLKYVQHEAQLLGVAEAFGPHIYGALDDYKNFSKQMVIERILRENSLRGEELIGFGDGFVEIQEIKKVGGTAIAVASDEAKREGVNQWKRQRLIDAGADVVIGDYRALPALMRLLFGDSW